ncbi:DUF6090 family protein [Mangrovimonas sp. ST2L15]|uniref:DUF6090 family protein n=1 Tax=Mangrovimonas sp. ST2L15 TaxID=1645916 RepID=UPI0006B64AD9|nr:DUF6090 family protein [Mangrovimonas sp. ST2L15]
MNSFFRNIRKNLLNEGKTGKYLKYAVGEIILVVIGILIALQINNWNKLKQDQKKEKLFLSEIMVNLKIDSLKLQEVLTFNKEKSEVTQNIMEIFDATLTSEERFHLFIENAGPFTKYELFKPKETAFKNLISSENLNLISNKTIRNQLIDYYEFDYEKYQERVWQGTRAIVDNYFSHFSIKEKTPFPNNFPSMDDMVVTKDNKFYTDLYGMFMTIDYQNNFIGETQEKNKKLIFEINNALN